MDIVTDRTTEWLNYVKVVSYTTEPGTVYSTDLLDKPDQLYGISFLFQNGKFLKVPEWI